MFTNEEAAPDGAMPSAANSLRRRRDRLAALQTTINAQDYSLQQVQRARLLRSCRNIGTGCALGLRITPVGN